MALSPMMQHYLQMKENYPNALMFYRLGDFYEMFFDDAVTASRVLELTLTGRDCGLDERAPMCGVPYHAVDTYIAKLIENGYNVAICEQLTEPKKGIMVERDVVRVITPGTVMDTNMLEDNKNNFVASIYLKNNCYSMSWVDISTGDFYVNSYKGEEWQKKLNDILVTVKPSEILCNDELKTYEDSLQCRKIGATPAFISYYMKWFDYDFALSTLKEQFGDRLTKFKIKDKAELIIASGVVIEYLVETQKRTLSHIKDLVIVNNDNYMNIDMNTRRNLEIVETMREHKKKGSLLWLLDKTETAMGGRLLRSWIEQPLYNDKLINLRLKAVKECVDNVYVRQTILENLNRVYDLERLCGKVSYGNLMPKDCIAIKNSLNELPMIKELVSAFHSTMLTEIYNDIFDFSDLTDMLERAIVDNPPLVLKEGGYIKLGYNKELDDLLNIGTYGKQLIAELEAKEKEETNIKNLKIGYNRVFGYYIEVLKSQIELVPYRYHRKQTTANAERYITDELKQLEDKIANAEVDRLALEEKLYAEIRQTLLNNIVAMQTTAKAIATLDSLLSLSQVAVERNYTMPIIGKNIEQISIIDGRHPVVEALLKDEQFVPNDTLLDGDENRTMIITGPNMAGKSTYMRQVAIITLMAHIGSFVPAKKAEIALTDRIFTRVGASDDLSQGQSTFMVEMVEVSTILEYATDKSLIILDEVGRGTSTFDGLSIAWSVMEYLSKHLKAKTLFATHYHELTELDGILEGVKNYRISVKELSNTIVFLRKIVRGGANRSFGIEVASLAGLPIEVINRAKAILHELEQKDISNNSALDTLDKSKVEKVNRNSSEVMSILRDIDINTLTPLSAFDIICNLSEKVKNDK